MVCLRESIPEVREQIQNLADKLGVDYGTAKIILLENNGYNLDKAPSGAESKLYLTLLEHYDGDERKALIAKAKTYLQPFFDWFGNWTDPDATDVSKVVDENGEPLVVWHGNRTNTPIREFDKQKIGSEHKPREISGFWFITDQRIAKIEYALKPEFFGTGKVEFGEILPVFLNIKNPVITEQNGIKTQNDPYIGNYTSAEETLNDFIHRSKEESTSVTDGFILTMVDSDNDADDYRSKQTQLVVFEPNQIKSIDNQGVFSTIDNNIYHNINIDDAFSRLRNNIINNNLSNEIKQRYIKIFNQTYGTSVTGYTKGKNFVMSRGVDNYANKVDRIPRSNSEKGLYVKQGVEKLVSHLNSKFNRKLRVHYLSDDKYNEQVLNLNAVGYDVDVYATSFIIGDDIIFKESGMTMDIAAEELLHPLIYTLKMLNKPLFDKLLNQAKLTYPKLSLEITSWYKSHPDSIDEEILTQALAREFTEQFRNKRINWKDVNSLKDFLKWVIEYLNEFILSRPLNVGKIPITTINSLKDFATILNTIELQFEIERIPSVRHHVKIDKTSEKLKKGIKQRLATIQRYQTKNIQVIRETQRLIDQLNKLDSIEGVIEFVNFVRDNIVDAFEFLNNPYEDINSTQIVQLKRDYLGFFIPMMNDIKMVIDTTHELDNIEDYDTFKQTVNSIVSGQATLMNKYQNILNQKTRDMLVEYAESAGSTTVDQLIDWLEDPNKDLNWFDEFLGQNSSTGNEVFRIMTDMLTNSVTMTTRNTYNEGIKLVNLLKTAKDANKGVDVMSLLLEKDKNGQTTGYFTRDLNYGLFYQDLQKEYDKIAQDMGLEKDSDGEIIFTDKEQEREFRKRRIKAQLKYGNLKYTKEYYDEKAKLPIEAQDALDYINSEIDYFIKSISTRDVIRWDKISAEKKAHLDNLYRQKAELYNEYYADGEAKSGIDLTIAQALQKMRKALKGKVKYKPDYLKFNESAKYIISKYGADSEQYEKWVESATDIVFTDEFYHYLDAVSLPKSEKVRELAEERNRLLDMYRDQGTRAIEMPIPDEIKTKIIEIDKKLASRKGTKLDTDFKFSDIAEMRKTKQYYEDARKAKEEGKYEEWYHKNHYEVNGRVRIASYYTYLYPKKDKFIIRQPNRFYSSIDLDSEYVNSEYDLNGEYVQPKRSLYDNSVAYNKVANNPTVKALYDALINKMTESNGKIAFALNQNPYRLPQISGRMMATIARSDDKFEALKYVVVDQFKIKDDDTDYVDSFEQRPDGSKIKLIPTRFMKMLDDPRMITSDVVGSVILYFEMAENYKNMSAIQNDLEMTLYHIEGLQVNTGDELKQGNNTRLYKKMVTLLDMNLYGKKKDKTTVKGYNLSKGLTKLFNYISLNNLAYNPWAITAGYVTGQGTLDIESIAGKYFNIDDITFAKVEFAKRLGHITMNIGNVNDKDKLVMLMQMNQVVRSNQETFDRLDQSAVLRGINQHFWYNGYTMGDFTVKSQLLMATYHSYKYVNGEYITKEQYIAKYYSDDRKTGESHFKAIVGTLWDAYDVLDGELKIVATGSLKSAAERVLNQVSKMINTLAGRVDGNITDTDRTLIHQNAITQFIAMHRNFLISGLQERLKSKQFNYSTGLTEGGMYSDAIKFVYNLVKTHHVKFLFNILSDYNNLDNLEKYNVRRVYMDMANIMMWSMLISTLFVAAADDDPDEWYLQALAYASTRISFEFRTLYNPLEVTNLFNSPSAAISTMENAFNYIKLIFPGTYFYESNVFSQVKSGVYKGWPKILRNTIKLTPIKNILEATDTRGVRAKRNYLENQMMF